MCVCVCVWVFCRWPDLRLLWREKLGIYLIESSDTFSVIDRRVGKKIKGVISSMMAKMKRSYRERKQVFNRLRSNRRKLFWQQGRIVLQLRDQRPIFGGGRSLGAFCSQSNLVTMGQSCGDKESGVWNSKRVKGQKANSSRPRWLPLFPFFLT